jgi:hypothetical protein
MSSLFEVNLHGYIEIECVFDKKPYNQKSFFLKTRKKDLRYDKEV